VTYPWVAIYRQVGEGQEGNRVPRGRVSSKGTQGFLQLYPGAALWTVNSGRRTQRPLPATRYDDDDEFNVRKLGLSHRLDPVKLEDALTYSMRYETLKQGVDEHAPNTTQPLVLDPTSYVYDDKGRKKESIGDVELGLFLH